MKFPLRCLAGVVAAAGLATAAPAEMKTGTPDLKSVSALAFGPDGVLFVGDPQSATVFAVATGDTKGSAAKELSVANLGSAVGSALGTTAENIAVNDVKVNPASGTVYLAVTRGKGKDALPLILTLDAKGQVKEFALKDVVCAPSVMAWITPVSCVGKNPFGIVHANSTVKSNVPPATPNVLRWCCKIHSSALP